MSWYAIEVIKNAYGRTKSCLFEPFNFSKWTDLAIMQLLLALVLRLKYYSPSYIHDSFESISNALASFNQTLTSNSYTPVSNTIDFLVGSFESLATLFSFNSGQFDSISSSATIVFMAIIFLMIIFSYVSCIMEFVFVESLVSNRVNFCNYSARFVGKGAQLFLVRGIILLPTLILLFLPLFWRFGVFSGSTYISYGMEIFFLATMFGLISLILDSFINLSIPLAMYCNISLISAIMEVFRKFRHDWQQILVYGIVRGLLGVIVGIPALVLMLLVITVTLLLFVFIFRIIQEPDLLILLSFNSLGLIIGLLALALVSMPFSLFMEYHLLSFMEKWYPEAAIPFNEGIDMNRGEKSTSAT